MLAGVTLARAAEMSPRTFVRQFKAQFKTQFKTTPARWVQSLRVEAAMQHLENREMSLRKIALATGFRDEQSLRRAFLQQTAVTPTQYRERFVELDHNSGARLVRIPSKHRFELV
jgi:transcriptional regulator GlxA family with amidase domain